MKVLLEKAGASFLRAFGVSLLVLIPGVLNAPNKTTAVALGIAATYASLAAGFRALQVFAPKITTGNAIADSFLRAFIGVSIASLAGLFAAPDVSVTKAALLGILIGAGTAAARAVQGYFTKGEAPVPGAGF